MISCQHFNISTDVSNILPLTHPPDMIELKSSITVRSRFDFFPLSMLRSRISLLVSVLKIYEGLIFINVSFKKLVR